MSGTSGTTYVGPIPPGVLGERAFCHELASMTYAAVQRVMTFQRPKIGLIPIGATEAHGPHLPLSTDSLISEEVARRAAFELAKRGCESIWFPTVHYGVTQWAAAFTGTTSISADVIENLLFETCSAAKQMGFDRIAIVNSHLEPDHVRTLHRVAERYEREHSEPLVFADQTRRRWAERLTEEFQSGSCHAGQYETSLVLAIRPEWVRLDVAHALPEHVVPLHEKIRAGAKDFADCGLDQAYCGNPAAASEAEGVKTLNVLAQSVAEAVLESLLQSKATS